MDMREQNREAIVSYFKSGIKPDNEPKRLGVELEHTITDDALQAVAYSGDRGVRWVLEQLHQTFPQRTEDANGNLLGVARSKQYVTIEPAAQLELSAGPYEHVGEIRIEFEQFQRDLGKILAKAGLKAVTVGYHPTACVDNLELIPKQRYRFMDDHFQRTGTMGRCMMRGSASTQVSIDYDSESDCLRKLRLSSGLAPLFAFLCDNAAVFEGAPRTKRMVRTEIWRNTDPARCGLVPNVMDPSFTLEHYAAYILDTPAIFTVDENGHSSTTALTFGELHSKEVMTTADVEHALSLLFNDVRLKTYIENRAADAMPIPFVAAYSALVKGLFYTDQGLQCLDDVLDSVTNDDCEAAKDALINDGYDAVVYGQKASDVFEKLFTTAHDCLASNEQSYLSPLMQLVTMHKTLADMAKQ